MAKEKKTDLCAHTQTDTSLRNTRRINYINMNTEIFKYRSKPNHFSFHVKSRDLFLSYLSIFLSIQWGVKQGKRHRSVSFQPPFHHNVTSSEKVNTFKIQSPMGLVAIRCESVCMWFCVCVCVCVFPFLWTDNLCSTPINHWGFFKYTDWRHMHFFLFFLICT